METIEAAVDPKLICDDLTTIRDFVAGMKMRVDDENFTKARQLMAFCEAKIKMYTPPEREVTDDGNADD